MNEPVITILALDPDGAVLGTWHDPKPVRQWEPAPGVSAVTMALPMEVRDVAVQVARVELLFYGTPIVSRPMDRWALVQAGERGIVDWELMLS